MNFPTLSSVNLELMARYYAKNYGRVRAANFFRALALAIETQVAK